MTHNQQVKNITGSIFLQLRELHPIRKYLDENTAKILVHALITSRLDYCNALLYGIPTYMLQQLQYAQNAAARFISKTRKYDHVSHIRQELHWLPVRERIMFGILVHVYKSQHGLSPAYIAELIEPYIPSRGLRSATDKHLLVEHKTKTKSFGDRAFKNAGPKLWNTLPISIRQSESLGQFKCQLKTHYFKQAYM